MGEILGLGTTHGPHLGYLDKDIANILKRYMTSPKTPEHLKDPRNWPELMQKEWGDDDGLKAAHEHRMHLLDGFRKARKALDAFNPDVVLIWGDDQYENLQEDVVPAFCVFAADSYEVKPWSRSSAQGTSANAWGEDADFTLRVKGHHQAGKELAKSLREQKSDVAYAYKQLHYSMSHAFWRTILYLDFDRKGFDYPVIPFHVNAYGSRLTGDRYGEVGSDPPGPSPERCFEVGAATARFFRDSPYRVALVGSSSWSHAQLTKKHHFMWPDVEADRQHFAELKASDYQAWKRIPISQIEDSGEHEMCNWMCMVGAMDELGRKPTYLDFVESWVFASCKTIAIFEPEPEKAVVR